MRPTTSQQGQMIITVVIFGLIMMIAVSSLVGYTMLQIKSQRQAVGQTKGLSIAEAGIEAAVWKLNNQPGYTGETGTSYGGGEYNVTITSIGGSKLSRADAFVPNAANPVSHRTVQVTTTVGSDQVSFNYGVQVGNGGLEMGQASQVTGNVYANGTITETSTGATVTGDAVSAQAAGKIDGVAVSGNATAHVIQNTTVGGNSNSVTLSGTTVTGNAVADSISNCTINGNATYDSKSNCTIGGTQIQPNPTNFSDPPTENFPISDQQVTDWKNDAAVGGTVGTYTLGQGQSGTLGPKKINGNLIMGKTATLTITGTLWVTGYIGIDKDATVALDASFGNSSGVIIADGIIDLSKEVNFQRAGALSYILALTTSNASNAVQVAKSADALIVYAANGTVDVQKSSTLREVTAYKLKLQKDTDVVYESGLANIYFSSGPGGSWQVLDGTWQLLQ